MDEKLIREVEQFLYREARWLDERRFHEWLELLTEDIIWMPVRTSRYPASSKAIAIFDPGRYDEEEWPRKTNWLSSTRLKRRLPGESHASIRVWLGRRTLLLARAT